MEEAVVRLLREVSLKIFANHLELILKTERAPLSIKNTREGLPPRRHGERAMRLSPGHLVNIQEAAHGLDVVLDDLFVVGDGADSL